MYFGSLQLIQNNDGNIESYFVVVVVLGECPEFTPYSPKLLSDSFA